MFFISFDANSEEYNELQTKTAALELKKVQWNSEWSKDKIYFLDVVCMQEQCKTKINFGEVTYIDSNLKQCGQILTVRPSDIALARPKLQHSRHVPCVDSNISLLPSCNPEKYSILPQNGLTLIWYSSTTQ